ncbi:MAG: GNAT family N-acetyltransferase [Leptolyngbya sp. SIO3F4]|nr:GNAT family N-acetyltransferase [Leptolyngbya sp. SIO3F4]
MISIRKALPAEILSFANMETVQGTAEFIIPYTLSKHYVEFSKPNVHYLSIIGNKDLAGFIMLVLDPDKVSVEFRRIVVATKGIGTGQAAITAMENYCQVHLKRQRIWLDVFEFNQRGRHIYEKLGYSRFNQGNYQGKALILYEKSFSNLFQVSET